jgi:cytochrome c oxidase subunit 2
LLVGLAIAAFGLVACGESQTAAATTAPAAAGALQSTEAPPTAAPAAGDVERGRALAEANGCVACHSQDGSTGVGPSWQGLFGSEEKLADGGSVTVDDAYLRESILAPDAKITAGFQAGLMPKTFADTLSEGDVNDLIALIGSL